MDAALSTAPHGMDNHCSFTRPSPTLCLRARWNCSLLICWHYRERTNSRLRSTVSQVQASTLLRELWLAPRFMAALLGSCCRDRKSTRLNSSHGYISYAVFCLKKKKKSTLCSHVLSHI